MSEPKFKVGDPVKDVGNGKAGVVKAISPVDGAVLVRFSADFCWWYELNVLDRLQPIANTPRPRFEPGQRVRINGMANPKWNGLEARIVGPDPDRDPGWWQVEIDSGGTPEVNCFHHSKLEPIADRHHDGQANTSGIELGPDHLHPSNLKGVGRSFPMPHGRDHEASPSLLERAYDAQAKEIEELRREAAHYREQLAGIIDQPQPSLLSVLVGIHRWQQVDTAHRRAHVSLSGHTATVHVTTLPDLGARRITFCSAYSAAEVVHVLDDLALVGAAHPDMEFKMARNDVRFREDTGEAD